MKRTTCRLFIGVSPGLEPLLVAEARRNGFLEVKRFEGGAELRTELPGLWTLAHTSRIAESIRLRLQRFKAHNFDELHEQLSKCAWAAYFPRGSKPEVQVVSRRSALYHTDAVKERAEATIAARLAGPEGCSAVAEGKIHLRIVNDEVQVSIDTVGERLHRRGIREHVGIAPIRETLAAALLAAADLTPEQPMWDPFCGSGTLLLERRLQHQRRLSRRFAFEAWPIHDQAAYAAFLQDAPNAIDVPLPSMFGSDIDEHSLDAARSNSEGMERIRWMSGDFQRHVDEVPEGAGVVSNLPYGKRTTERGIIDTFRRFGALLTSRLDLGPVVVLNGHPGFVDATRLTWEPLFSFRNRGLPVQLLRLKR
ncbi:MAG: hypothetical protein AUK47_03260 [Deltaproteobacteria bacterium CG2_30_63_29]|nr:MAG: hypothetical protein AUK47_03260 [Deltaproteobacteria bacterium CG2_30_63_29]